MKENYQILTKIVTDKKLNDNGNLIKFIKENSNTYNFYTISKIAEIANSNRLSNAAFYTDEKICEHMVSKLPDYTDDKYVVNILEPSVGAGNFLPALIKKYSKHKRVIIDVVDIDDETLGVLKILLKISSPPFNVEINYINDDFLLHQFTKNYDIVIGNPPFQKVKDKTLLSKYKASAKNTISTNIFAYFIEKSINIGDYVSLVIPKSTIYTPEHEITRDIIEHYPVLNITDYGEEGFKGVKIETVSILVKTKETLNKKHTVEVDSFIKLTTERKHQKYIMPEDLPSWLIYRNDFFDSVLGRLQLDVFHVTRDRQITKKDTKETGPIRVLKSRNIGTCKIVDIPQYDSYVNDAYIYSVSKFLNKSDVVVAPNLTYYPRASLLPKDTIADGSVGLLIPKDGRKIKKEDLEYFGSKEFTEFYRIVKNFGTRSLNLDKNAVYFWGIRKT